jgi:hypothetical protein
MEGINNKIELVKGRHGFVIFSNFCICLLAYLLLCKKLMNHGLEEPIRFYRG